MNKKIYIIFFVITMAVVAFASLYASSHPDGLEWVAEKLGFISQAQDAPLSSPMPDYSILTIKSEFWTTFLAGIVGATILFFAFFVPHLFLRQRGKIKNS